MAGPSTLALGGFAFEAYGFSYEERSRRLDARWASIPLAGAVDARQWTGGTGRTETIRGVLFPAEFGGLAALDGIAALASAGQPVPFVSIGDGNNVFGMVIIEEVEEDIGFVLADGTPMKNGYRIELAHFPGRDFTPASVLTGLVGLF